MLNAGDQVRWTHRGPEVCRAGERAERRRALAHGAGQEEDGSNRQYELRRRHVATCSILKLDEGIFEVIATGGDTHGGGDDIENLLIADRARRHRRRRWASAVGRGAKARGELVQARPQGRHRGEDRAVVDSPRGERLQVALLRRRNNPRCEISRERFEASIAPMIERTAARSSRP